MRTAAYYGLLTIAIFTWPVAGLAPLAAWWHGLDAAAGIPAGLLFLALAGACIWVASKIDPARRT